ncbi:hypothetical protein JKP88DRAFT_334930 [Tribonema minus]|uniref:protochlorophyllide reductase n=1 Tax=Tribonema minus TaxID=303371 RepID=A0A836C919_9STRA|nr:hypothetical protein JKP88DRAFT_334930 [Tribonema minus]
MSAEPQRRGSNSSGGSGDATSRRGFAGVLATSAAAGSLLALQGAVPPASAADKKTIVITGASSGIGLDAATKLAAAGHDVYVACRTEDKAATAAFTSKATGAYACDLSSLDSIRTFVKLWGDRPIDVLCLNAGMAPATKGEAQYTKEGFEVAIGTNHLGHFLLANLLLDRLEASGAAEPRLIVTASSVHDPATPGGDVGSKATLGDMAGLAARATGAAPKFDMVDGGSYDGDKAYKDSKLCNVLFTRELNRRLTKKDSKVHVNCFSPGLIPTSGLFRSQNPLFVKVFGFAAGSVLGIAATIGEGGDALSYMATSDELVGKGGLFLATDPGKPKSAFKARTPSQEALDDAKAQRLWELSEKCVGLA